MFMTLYFTKHNINLKHLGVYTKFAELIHLRGFWGYLLWFPCRMDAPKLYRVYCPIGYFLFKNTLALRNSNMEFRIISELLLTPKQHVRLNEPTLTT